ncbi:MAG: hypothetical protein P8Q14_03895 [Vicingaceae bacterium]|nr:hypothetical protein [Vicingaceae bacterium]
MDLFLFLESVLSFINNRMGAPMVRYNNPNEAIPDHFQKKAVKTTNNNPPYVAKTTKNSNSGGLTIFSVFICFLILKNNNMPTTGIIKWMIIAVAYSDIIKTF